MVLPNDPEQARAILNELVPEVHASAKAALISSSEFQSNAALSQIRAAFDGVGSSAAQQERFNLNRRQWGLVEDTSSAVWIRPVVSWGENPGGTGFKGIEYETTGILFGADLAVQDDWRLGFFSGLSRTEFSQFGAEGEDNGLHAGLYGGGRLGDFLVRGGVSHVAHSIETSRTLASANGLQVTGEYDARTLGAFSEIGYRIDAFRGATSVEPFVGFNYSTHSTDEFNELFSIGEGSSETGGAEIGFRASFPGGILPLLPTDSALNWTLMLNVSLKDPKIAVPLTAGDSQSVEIRGVPFSANSIAIELGMDMGLGRGMDANVSYSYASQAEGDGDARHSFAGRITYSF